MDSSQLIQELVRSFNALADEVQNLTDRKTILEHKLRYAHEQVRYAAVGMPFNALCFDLPPFALHTHVGVDKFM